MNNKCINKVLCVLYKIILTGPSLPLKCKADTCENGGKCVTDTTYKSIEFKCECPTGYYGALCEKSIFNNQVL